VNLFSRIGIGTAGWAKPYNGVRVSDDDQKRIMDYAMSCGIDMIDTATAYGVDWTKWSSYFKIVLKIKATDDWSNLPDAWCIMAHESEAIDTCLDAYGKYPTWGVSAYVPQDLIDIRPLVVQVPYSLYDRRFEDYFAGLQFANCEIHVRSVFLRGKIFEKTTPQECLKFVLCNPYVDRVIIGADSFEQFRNNVQFIHTWNSMEKHDEQLLDPRKWSDSGE